MAMKSQQTKKDATKAPAISDEAVENSPEMVEEEVVETKEVVVKAPSAVSTSVGKLVLPLEDLKNALPPMEFGTLPRIKANQGCLEHDDDGDIGKSITIEVISFNDRYVVSPNQNGADASFCRYSYDNAVLNDGSEMSVAEHIQELKDEGFTKACSKRYVDLIAVLVDAENDCDDIGQMVQLQLSPESVKQFDRLKMNILTANRGQKDVAAVGNIIVTAKKKTYNTNTFTLMTFKQA
jgi:hypothetical protein